MDKTEGEMTAANKEANDEKDDEIFIKVTTNEGYADEKQSRAGSHSEVDEIVSETVFSRPLPSGAYALYHFKS